MLKIFIGYFFSRAADHAWARSHRLKRRTAANNRGISKRPIRNYGRDWVSDLVSGFISCLLSPPWLWGRCYSFGCFRPVRDAKSVAVFPFDSVGDDNQSAVGAAGVVQRGPCTTGDSIATETFTRNSAAKNGDIFEEGLVEKVRVGDIIAVKSGARIPLDGAVVLGASTVDQAPITGESMPVEKKQGDQGSCRDNQR